MHPDGFAKASPANAAKMPVVRNIFDFSAESLGQLRTWLEQNPPAIPISQLVGYQQFAYTQVRRAAALAASPVPIALTFDTEDTDGLSVYDAGSPTKFTFVASGFYIAFASVTATGQTGAGQCSISIERFNSGAVLQEVIGTNSTQNLNDSSSASGGFKASPTDYVQILFVSGATGAAGTVTARFSLIKLPG